MLLFKLITFHLRQKYSVDFYLIHPYQLELLMLRQSSSMKLFHLITFLFILFLNLKANFGASLLLKYTLFKIINFLIHGVYQYTLKIYHHPDLYWSFLLSIRQVLIKVHYMLLKELYFAKISYLLLLSFL